jgi:hypothetical protein
LASVGRYSIVNRVWWPIPVILMLLLITAMVFAGQTAAPFIYTLF